MKILTCILLFFIACFWGMFASAQQTWDYTGQTMSVTPNGEAPLSLDAVFVLGTPLNPNEANQIVTPTSWSINGMGLGSTYNTQYGGPSVSVVFTTVDDSITAWDVIANSGPPQQGTNTFYYSSASIDSNGGDSFNGYFTTPTCNAPAGVAVPCYNISESTTADGVWVDPPTAAAPEMDPASATAGLLLLIGGLAVARGRRH
jgi:hypothetical protein